MEQMGPADHRWLSIALRHSSSSFVTLGIGEEPDYGYIPAAVPLALLMLTGLYLFVLPMPPVARRATHRARVVHGGKTSSAERPPRSRPPLGRQPQIAKADGDAPVRPISRHAGWKSGSGAASSAHRAHRPGRPKAVNGTRPLWHPRPGLVLGVRASPTTSSWRSSRRGALNPVPPANQGPGHALLTHPRGRPARRGARGELGQAGSGAARLGPVTSRPRKQGRKERSWRRAGLRKKSLHPG